MNGSKFNQATVPNVLIADDEVTMRLFVKGVLEGLGCRVTEYDPWNPDEEVLRKSYDVAVLDIVMPETDGCALRREMLKYSATTQFIIMTAFPDEEKHEKAFDIGAFMFLVKPFRAEHMRYAILGALCKQKNYNQIAYEKTSTNNETLGLTGESQHLSEVRQRIVDLAPLEIPTLITGESGTGKEVVARSIHENSPRAKHPFIPINCGSLSPTLIESELFGHAQGAFTGAHKTKHGFFEAADGGTIFLDEIGELPMELQSKFLRVLDSGEFTRIGENTPRKANVRIVSATNRDLAAMVENGQFRRDLFFRLRGGLITLAPLRERKDDIISLIHHYLDNDHEITPAAIERLRSFDWPGNVRELIMAITNLKGVCLGSAINEEMVDRILCIQCAHDKNGRILSYQAMKSRVINDFESDYFSSLLKQTNNNITRAAQLANMDRKNLRMKLKKLGMN